MPSIEIVDSRFLDWTSIGINNLIADNAANAYWIYGNEVNNLNSFDLNNHSVSVYRNNKIISQGNSNNVLGNPINSLTWLINNMKKYGQNIEAGSYVSTGTCTPAIPIKKNDYISANFGNLGSVDFKLI